MSSTPRSGGELDWLTFCRFFAASWVVVHHLGFFPLDLSRPVAERVERFRENGHMGVAFFFVLSGFILTHVYGDRKEIGYRSFLVARLARIYPVYLFALILAIPMLVPQIQQHVSHHGATIGGALIGIKSMMVLTLSQAWYPSASLIWNGVSWSLSAEAFFYLLFPSILPRMRRASTPAIVSILVACLLLEVGRAVGNHLHPSLGWGFVPLLRIGNFLTGISLRLLMDRGLMIPFWTAAPALACFVWIQATFKPSASDPNLGMLVASQLAMLTMIASLAVSRPTKHPRPMMALPILLGQISYSLYLLHFPLATIWTLLFPSEGRQMHLTTFFAVLLLVCWAVYALIEAPSREWIRRRFAPIKRTSQPPRGPITPSAPTGSP